jgi:hypothetical protein
MKNFAQKIFQVVIALIISVNLAFAQNEFGGVIKFDKTVHDFGDILISDGEQKCVFTYTNISDKPLVVHRVISSCGCTEPAWDKRPLRPGEKGTINISFKNDQGPYPFDKGITVYVSDVTKPVVLRIRGVAHNKKKSLEEMFPEKFGAVGFKSKILALGQIEQGMARNESVEVANLSNKEVTVSFSNLTPGLLLSPEKLRIPAKGRGVLTYVVDTKNTNGKCWGKSVFKAQVLVNGQPQKGELVVETLVKENFSNYSQEQLKAGALPKFVTSSISFGRCKAGDVKKLSFNFTNMGKETMKIYKVEASEVGCSFKYPEVTAASQKGLIEVTLDTSSARGEVLYVISVITNAPTRPIVNLFITGEIEK